MMRDLLLWTLVVGGTPLALALIQRAVEWSRDTFRARTIAGESAAGERPASDDSRLWIHAGHGRPRCVATAAARDHFPG